VSSPPSETRHAPTMHQPDAPSQMAIPVRLLRSELHGPAPPAASCLEEHYLESNSELVQSVLSLRCEFSSLLAQWVSYIELDLDLLSPCIRDMVCDLTGLHRLREELELLRQQR